MSYSAKGADAWIAEQNYEIERQHREITELSAALSASIAATQKFAGDADDLEASLGRAREDVRELETALTAAGQDIKDAEALAEARLRNLVGYQGDAKAFGDLADRLSAAISSAIEDLRLLSEVPLGQLEDAIKAIADRLADKNGELY